MQLLRSFLRVKPINRTARLAGRMLLRGRARQEFERKLPLVEAFTISVPNGVPIHFEPFGDVCSKHLRFGGWNAYERPSIELFYALAQHARVTFDVGAYLGYFALVAAAARPGAQVYAFEALPRLAELAGRLAARNNHLSVTVVPAAVADVGGTVTIYPPRDIFSSDASANPQHRPNRVPISVKAVSLDDFVKENHIDEVDLLKIDTETTEPAVLSGFAETISRCRPTFICEVLPTADVGALEQFCLRHGYDTAMICESGLVACPRLLAQEHRDGWNYLFYPRSSTGPMAATVRELLSRSKAQ